MNTYEYLGATLACSLVTAVIAAWLSAILATRRTIKERRWERKEKAYAEILEAVFQCLQVEKEGRLVFVHDVPRGESQSESEKKFADASNSLERAVAIGSFVVTPKVALVVKKLLDEWGRHHQEGDGEGVLGIYDGNIAAYERAIVEIQKLAKKDLGVK